MQQSVYEGLLAQGGSAPLPGELGDTRLGGFQATQALVGALAMGLGWHVYNDYHMIAGALIGFIGLAGVFDSAY